MPVTKASLLSKLRFMECMMKIGLEYLSYHGNVTQQALPSCQKLLWLFAFLTWSFETAQQRLQRPGSESSSASRCASREPSRQASRQARLHSRRDERRDMPVHDAMYIYICIFYNIYI